MRSGYSYHGANLIVQHPDRCTELWHTTEGTRVTQPPDSLNSFYLAPSIPMFGESISYRLANIFLFVKSNYTRFEHIELRVGEYLAWGRNGPVLEPGSPEPKDFRIRLPDDGTWVHDLYDRRANHPDAGLCLGFTVRFLRASSYFAMRGSRWDYDIGGPRR
jgi:hypothetical protein